MEILYQRNTTVIRQIDGNEQPLPPSHKYLSPRAQERLLQSSAVYHAL